METGKSQKFSVRELAYISLFAVVIAVCSWICVPAMIPFTMQTLGVFTTVGCLGGKRGTVAVLLYLFLGVIGLPVFAGFQGGIGVLMGTTGGYLFGFLGSALIMWAMEHLFGNSKTVLFLSMLAGLLVCYCVGTLWFAAVYARTSGAVGIWTVLLWCVAPYVVPDLVKIALSMVLCHRLKNLISL